MDIDDLLKKPMVLAIAGVVIALIAVGGFLYYRSTQASKLNTQNPQAAQAEVRKVVAAVGKLIDLPPGEDPTIATVTDATKLQDQPFFQKAKNGDKVLIYSGARKAILYDPQAKKVIDVAPINIGSPSAQQASAVVKIVLRNGTTTAGLTSKVEPEVKKSLPSVQIVDKGNAAKNDYEKTIVVVLNEGVRDQAVKLAKDLEASLSALSKEESKPKDVDILVILGKDRT